MNARDKAVQAAVESMPFRLRGDYENRILERAGRAASDVWEPMLKEALELLADAMTKPQLTGHASWNRKAKEAWHRLWDSLDENIPNNYNDSRKEGN